MNINSYCDLLEKSGLPSLHIRKNRNMSIDTYTTINGLSPPVLSDLVVKKNSNSYFRYTNILQIPLVRTSLYGKTHLDMLRQ